MAGRGGEGPVGGERVAGEHAGVWQQDDVRERLAAAEAELADLNAAEAFADRRYRVAGEFVEAAWEQLETAQREREEAREARARIRAQRTRLQSRITRLHNRTTG